MGAVQSKSVGKDLTQGPIFKTLVIFAIPIVLTNIIQQLYGMVDLVIIGKFVGNTGTVGVSTGGEIADMVTPVAMAFSMAGQIYIAQLFGAKLEKKVKTSVGTLISFMLLLSCILAGVAIIFCRPILLMLNCPTEALGQAQAYMIITALGYPFIFGYNAVCGILRGMGESKRPMIFIIVAAVVNIVMDTLLVAIFGMQADGTAIATTLSQLGSFLAAGYYLYKRRDKFDFSLSLSYFKIDFTALRAIVKLGVPQAIRSLLVRCSLLWVNAQINVYGLDVSATNSIGNKIQKFAEVFMQGMDTASSAMIGQNLGAHRTDRAGKATLASLAFNMICATIVSALSLLLPRQIFGLFTNEEAVIAIGILYLQLMVIHFYSSGFVGSFQAMVNGCGFVTFGFAIGILDGVICKIGLSLIFVNVMGMGYMGYFWAIACSRVLPGVLCFLYFLSGKWKTRKLLTGE